VSNKEEKEEEEKGLTAPKKQAEVIKHCLAIEAIIE